MDFSKLTLEKRREWATRKIEKGLKKIRSVSLPGEAQPRLILSFFLDLAVKPEDFGQQVDVQFALPVDVSNGLSLVVGFSDEDLADKESAYKSIERQIRKFYLFNVLGVLTKGSVKIKEADGSEKWFVVSSGQLQGPEQRLLFPEQRKTLPERGKIDILNQIGPAAKAGKLDQSLFLPYFEIFPMEIDRAQGIATFRVIMQNVGVSRLGEEIPFPTDPIEIQEALRIWKHLAQIFWNEFGAWDAEPDIPTASEPKAKGEIDTNFFHSTIRRSIAGHPEYQLRPDGDGRLRYVQQTKDGQFLQVRTQEGLPEHYLQLYEKGSPFAASFLKFLDLVPNNNDGTKTVSANSIIKHFFPDSHLGRTALYAIIDELVHYPTRLFIDGAVRFDRKSGTTRIQETAAYTVPARERVVKDANGEVIDREYTIKPGEWYYAWRDENRRAFAPITLEAITREVKLLTGKKKYVAAHSLIAFLEDILRKRDDLWGKTLLTEAFGSEYLQTAKIDRKERDALLHEFFDAIIPALKNIGWVITPEIGTYPAEFEELAMLNGIFNDAPPEQKKRGDNIRLLQATMDAKFRVQAPPTIQERYELFRNKTTNKRDRGASGQEKAKAYGKFSPPAWDPREIEAAMKALNMSQRELAKLVGFGASQKWVHGILKGVPITDENRAKRLAEVLGLPKK